MKKRYFIIILISCFLFIVPNKILAKDYECYYENENGTASAGYNPSEGKVYLIKWGSKEINKYVSTNRSKGNYKPNKCYNYICIIRKKESNKNYTSYYHAFYLGDKKDDFTSATDCNMWSRQGIEIPENEKIIKKCSNDLSPTTINLQNMNFDIEDKPGVSHVNFTFYTYADNTRSFCVSYDQKVNCSNKFSGSEAPTVNSNIKNKSGNLLSFTIDGESKEKYFSSCVSDKTFQLTENGNTFMIGIKKTSNSETGDKYDQGAEVTGCDVVPKEIRNWIRIALNFVKYIALVLVIVLGTIDFIKAAGSGEPDAMKKAGQTFIKRVVAVIILFLLPMIVELILNLINLYGATDDCFNVLN